MDPNVKLMFEEGFKQLRAEIKEGFAVHEAAFTKRLEEVTAAEQQRDTRVATLEATAASFDKVLSEWKPEVESSISAIKLELSKLNGYFNRDVKASSSQPDVLQLGSAAASSPVDSGADGPNGHRVDSNHRDCGFGQVFVQTHDPVKCTVHSPPPPPNFSPLPHGMPSSDPSRFTSQPPLHGRADLGQLPKLHFP
jgi:hypothetical protein